MNQSDKRAKKQSAKRKLSDNLLALYFLTLLLILLGQNLGMLVYLIPHMTNTDVGATIAMYLSFIGIWILAVAYMRFTKKNRPILEAIGRNASGNNWKNLLFGFFIGFVLNGICILAAWLHKDISLYYDSFLFLNL